jgi:hypothetical protein
VHKKSNRKLFEVCREHFLSYVRMREWRDLGRAAARDDERSSSSRR